MTSRQRLKTPAWRFSDRMLDDFKTNRRPALRTKRAGPRKAFHRALGPFINARPQDLRGRWARRFAPDVVRGRSVGMAGVMPCIGARVSMVDGTKSGLPTATFALLGCNRNRRPERVPARPTPCIAAVGRNASPKAPRPAIDGHRSRAGAQRLDHPRRFPASEGHWSPPERGRSAPTRSRRRPFVITSRAGKRRS